MIPVDQAGVPTYDELVLVVREGEARTDGQDLRAFLQALTRGEREVRSNPAAAAALVVKANPSLEPKLQLESIKQTLPAAQPADASDPFGWQNPAAWATFGSWMLAHGLLAHDPERAACRRSPTSSCPVRDLGDGADRAAHRRRRLSGPERSDPRGRATRPRGRRP